MRIELPIIFHTEESYQAEQLGIPAEIDEGEVKTMIFYEISALSPYTNDGQKYTRVYTSANSFICTLNIKEIDQLIQDSWK